MIEIKNVRKIFNDFEVLKDINLVINEENIFGIIKVGQVSQVL